MINQHLVDEGWVDRTGILIKVKCRNKKIIVWWKLKNSKTYCWKRSGRSLVLGTKCQVRDTTNRTFWPLRLCRARGRVLSSELWECMSPITSRPRDCQWADCPPPTPALSSVTSATAICSNWNWLLHLPESQTKETPKRALADPQWPCGTNEKEIRLVQSLQWDLDRETEEPKGKRSAQHHRAGYLEGGGKMPGPCGALVV